jgi:hypothetical protein
LSCAVRLAVSWLWRRWRSVARLLACCSLAVWRVGSSPGSVCEKYGLDPQKHTRMNNFDTVSFDLSNPFL